MKKLIGLVVCILAVTTFVYAQPAIDVEITPDDPILLPPEGGWFEFSVSIENTTMDTVWFDAWIDVELPWGWSFTIVSPIELYLPGGYYGNADLWLWMPWFAPEGEYSLTAYVGDYPDDIWDEDNLTVIKEESDGVIKGPHGWAVKGDLTSMEKTPISGQWDDYIDITITPDDPIMMPPEGGWFEVGVGIANTTADTVWFDAWMDVELPWGFSFTLVSPIELWLPGGYEASAELWLWMPWFAPEGTYSITAYVGDYPDDIWDEDNLTVIKEEWDGGSRLPAGWAVKGSLMPDEIMPVTTAPDKYTLTGNYPNPFNPSTTISFSLPEATRVELAVYDLSGRLVATLTNGWMQAGSHEVTFDGSNLASGVYVYKMMAGDFSASGKMVLMK